MNQPLTVADPVLPFHLIHLVWLDWKGSLPKRRVWVHVLENPNTGPLQHRHSFGKPNLVRHSANSFLVASDKHVGRHAISQILLKRFAFLAVIGPVGAQVLDGGPGHNSAGCEEQHLHKVANQSVPMHLPNKVHATERWTC
jgi:hypothetical protein